jgi:hypothetical protein
MSISQKILNLTRQLYPTGRAFKMPIDGWLDKMHDGLAVSETQAYLDAVSILDSLLPDNSNFSVDDAEDWERRLGMIPTPLSPLASRKSAILRKLQFPNRNPAKGHYLYIEQQLQLAGFNVYVYENKFPYYYNAPGYYTVNPASVNPLLFSDVQHGDHQHGDVQHGGYLNNIIVNHIDENRDLTFNIGQNLRCTFFISGATLGTYVNIPLARKDEFRQLVLKLKQTQTVAICTVNYV